jgi:hypothetical protein
MSARSHSEYHYARGHQSILTVSPARSLLTEQLHRSGGFVISIVQM